jgi:putative restriction endonuclease
VDLETEIVYTGQGGRDPNTGKQVTDQELTLGNRALVVSRSQGLPVRVVRRVPEGYRYAGLYRVADAWHEKGKSGFKIWRYRLVAIDATATKLNSPVIKQNELFDDGFESTPGKKTSTVSRVIRDTVKSRDIKALYDYTCQVCGVRLEGPAGPYAEAAHIRPLGAPHGGPDTYGNLLCLCPNHHVLFDLGGFTVADDLTLEGLSGKLCCKPKHKINIDNIRYHREHYTVE